MNKEILERYKGQVLCNYPGAGVLLYISYMYASPQMVWILSRFGLETGIDFDHYGLKSGMVSKVTTRACKR